MDGMKAARLGLTLICLGLALAPAPGCGDPPVSSVAGFAPLDAPALPPRGFFMGLLPTPRAGQTLAEAYAQAAAFADFTPVWGRPTPFYDLAQELAGAWGQVFVAQYTRGNGLFPLVHLSFLGPDLTLAAPPGLAGATLADAAWRESYRAAALAVVRAVQPRYLSLGNEVNRWYEQHGARPDDPNGFQHFVSLYHEVYDAVKQLSPATQVCCTFAREIVAGHREADLAVLRLFDPAKLDMLLLTSYPSAVAGCRQPADIPDDYYLRAERCLPGKPFGLSEAGWPALAALGGEQAQADFIAQLTGRLIRAQGLDLKLLGWPWLSALDRDDPVSLFRPDGTPRPALAAWQQVFAGGEPAPP